MQIKPEAYSVECSFLQCTKLELYVNSHPGEIFRVLYRHKSSSTFRVVLEAQGLRTSSISFYEKQNTVWKPVNLAAEQPLQLFGRNDLYFFAEFTSLQIMMEIICEIRLLYFSKYFYNFV